MKLKFICAQPATIYYSWQCEVMINNFLSMGIPLDSINIISWTEGEIPLEWQKLSKHYPANFFFIKILDRPSIIFHP